VGLDDDMIAGVNDLNGLKLVVIPLIGPRSDGFHHTGVAVVSHRIWHVGRLDHDDLGVHRPQDRFQSPRENASSADRTISTFSRDIALLLCQEPGCS
jgi:hypothetical protein